MTARYGTVHSANRNSKLKCMPYFFNHAGSVQHSRNDPYDISLVATQILRFQRWPSVKYKVHISNELSMPQKITGNPYNKQ